MAVGRVDDGFDHLGRGVGLSDAFESVVGANPHQHDVLATRRLLPHRFDTQDLTEELVDFHGAAEFQGDRVAFEFIDGGKWFPHCSTRALDRCVQPPNAFRSLRQTPLNALDTPLETLLFGVTVEDRFDTPIGHQGVEINRVPAAGVDANGWNAKLIGDLNAFLRVLDVFADHLRLWTHEVL